MSLLDSLRRLFASQPTGQRCETCSRTLRVMEFSGKGSAVVKFLDVGAARLARYWGFRRSI